MCHPFFDELRDPETKLPDSRHNGAPRDMPELFDFSRHGMFFLFCSVLEIRLLTSHVRTFDCSSIERPSRSLSCSSCSCRSRPRPRNAQASFEGANDGTSRLSRICAVILGRVRLFGFLINFARMRTRILTIMQYEFSFNIAFGRVLNWGQKKRFLSNLYPSLLWRNIWELVSLRGTLTKRFLFFLRKKSTQRKRHEKKKRTKSHEKPKNPK